MGYDDHLRALPASRAPWSDSVMSSRILLSSEQYRYYRYQRAVWMKRARYFARNNSAPLPACRKCCPSGCCSGCRSHAYQNWPHLPDQHLMHRIPYRHHHPHRHRLEFCQFHLTGQYRAPVHQPKCDMTTRSADASVCIGINVG